jgi:hypothetical protein
MFSSLQSRPVTLAIAIVLRIQLFAVVSPSWRRRDAVENRIVGCQTLKQKQTTELKQPKVQTRANISQGVLLSLSRLPPSPARLYICTRDRRRDCNDLTVVNFAEMRSEKEPPEI